MNKQEYIKMRARVRKTRFEMQRAAEGRRRWTFVPGRQTAAFPGPNGRTAWADDIWAGALLRAATREAGRQMTPRECQAVLTMVGGQARPEWLGCAPAWKAGYRAGWGWTGPNGDGRRGVGSEDWIRRLSFEMTGGACERLAMAWRQGFWAGWRDWWSAGRPGIEEAA